jgi:hypothetical protein
LHLQPEDVTWTKIRSDLVDFSDNKHWLAELAVFSSAEGARALRKILSDAIIPADVVRRLEASGVRPDRLKTVS